jgi:hypothetical protein
MYESTSATQRLKNLPTIAEQFVGKFWYASMVLRKMEAFTLSGFWR